MGVVTLSLLVVAFSCTGVIAGSPVHLQDRDHLCSLCQCQNGDESVTCDGLIGEVDFLHLPSPLQEVRIINSETVVIGPEAVRLEKRYLSPSQHPS